MTELTLVYIAFVLLLGLFAFAFFGKKVAVVFLICAYAVLYLGSSELMGRSKPILVPDQGEVIAYYLQEGRAIHVWLFEDGPRAYRLPWSMKQAKELRQAFQKAKQSGAGLLMNSTPEGEYVFHPRPPAENPPK